MMKTVFKRAVTLAICAVTVFCGIFACSGATKDYEIPQIDDMTLSMPDGMSAVTRDSKSTDKYFSVFGLDYDTTMKTFQNGNIYLQGMDNMSSVILTVTMTKNESSENVGNYAQLSSSELSNIRNNFLNSDEYLSCTPDQKEKAVWLVFDATAQSSKGDVKTFIANTVYDGMNINITMQRTEGDVTTVDYDTFSKIVSSVKFSDLPFSKGFIPYIIIGGGVVILILIVLIIIFAVRIRKRLRRITLFLRSLQSSINSVKRVRTTTLTILTILPKSPINAQRKSRNMRKRLKKNRLCRAEDMLPSR
jgi:Sec-independent protein translocase protein TatA